MARKNMLGRTVGGIALLVAVVLGLLDATGAVALPIQEATITTLLVVGGLIVGFLNIKSGESTAFLVSVIALGIGAASLSVIPFVGDLIGGVAARVATLVIPAAIIVSLMTIWRTART